MSGPLGAGELRELIGTILLCLMGLFAAVWIVYRNWSGIKELCTDEDGNFDLLGGLERHFSGGGSSGGAQASPEEVTADEDVMQRLISQKGAQMADFDPAKDWIREHIIFHGRVQGVGFRYQAMYAARSFDLTGWVENLPDGSVEMEVQGTAVGIGRLLTHLQSGHWIRIDKMDMEEMAVVPDERGFGVRGY